MATQRKRRSTRPAPKKPLLAQALTQSPSGVAANRLQPIYGRGYGPGGGYGRLTDEQWQPAVHPAPQMPPAPQAFTLPEPQMPMASRALDQPKLPTPPALRAFTPQAPQVSMASQLAPESQSYQGIRDPGGSGSWMDPKTGQMYDPASNLGRPPTFHGPGQTEPPAQSAMGSHPYPGLQTPKMSPQQALESGALGRAIGGGYDFSDFPNLASTLQGARDAFPGIRSALGGLNEFASSSELGPEEAQRRQLLEERYQAALGGMQSPSVALAKQPAPGPAPYNTGALDAGSYESWKNRRVPGEARLPGGAGLRVHPMMPSVGTPPPLESEVDPLRGLARLAGNTSENMLPAYAQSLASTNKYGRQPTTALTEDLAMDRIRSTNPEWIDDAGELRTPMSLDKYIESNPQIGARQIVESKVSPTLQFEDAEGRSHGALTPQERFARKKARRPSRTPASKEASSALVQQNAMAKRDARQQRIARRKDGPGPLEYALRTGQQDSVQGLMAGAASRNNTRAGNLRAMLEYQVGMGRNAAIAQQYSPQVMQLMRSQAISEHMERNPDATTEEIESLFGGGMDSTPGNSMPSVPPLERSDDFEWPEPLTGRRGFSVEGWLNRIRNRGGRTAQERQRNWAYDL